MQPDRESKVQSDQESMVVTEERDPLISDVESEEISPLDDSDDPWIGCDDNPSARETTQRVESSARNGNGANGPRSRSSDLRSSTGSLVADPEGLRRKWESIQVGFVDDPRRAVEDGEQLVSIVVEELVDNFARQRRGLETSWSEGSDPSVNDLREAFQSDRSFFERLLNA